MKSTAPHTTLLSFIAQEFNEGILWGRLRGIDTPEMNTAAGRKTKRFVESTLGFASNEQRFEVAPGGGATSNDKANSIIIHTSTSDKYDRYLADIFYNSTKKPRGLRYLNQELLDAGHAQRYEK